MVASESRYKGLRDNGKGQRRGLDTVFTEIIWLFGLSRASRLLPATPLLPPRILKQLDSYRGSPEDIELRPSSVAPDPAESRGSPPTPQDPSPLRGTLGSSLRFPAEGEGNEGFPPPSNKDFESPSSTHLEALVPSRDSRATTRSPSPRAWRPDFPGAAREAP